MPDKRHEDSALKRLFALPEVVRSYLDHAPLPRELKGALDFATLRQLPTEFISANLMKRYADLLWQVDYYQRKGQLYVIVEIEFQSAPDPDMPLRMLTYASLIYESLWRTAQPRNPSYRLPAVLPLVIYTGEAAWKVPQSVDALMGSDLKSLRPSFQYLLLAEQDIVNTEKAIQAGPAGDLMLFRHTRDYGMMLEVYERIIRSEIYQSNQNTYAELLQEFGRGMFGTEVKTMDDMKARLEEMDRNSIAKGFKQGMEQGMEQGIERGKLQGMEQGIERGKLQGMEQGIERGIEQGKLQGIEFVASQMLDKGWSASEIETYTGLTHEQIQELRRTE